MKICFICNEIFSVGGIQRVLSVLASELSRNNDVTIITFENSNNEDRSIYDLSGDITIKYVKRIEKKYLFRRLIHRVNKKTGILKFINSDRLYDWFFLPKAQQEYWISFINGNDFDAVIALTGRESIVLGSIANQLDCRAIGWQHNSYAAYLESKGEYFWAQDYLFRTYLPCLDRCVVLNEYDAEQYKIKQNVECTVIYNPRSFKSNQKAELNNKLFIAVGNLKCSKGFDLLIDSFKIFSQQDNDWKLIIFGEGPDRKYLERKINDYRLNDQIYMPGYSTDIKRELLKASIFLLPSKWEGMPMVILEAFEVGLPVIAYDITAMKPLVTNGREGIIVPPFETEKFGEAMLKLTEDHSTRKAMGKMSAEKSQDFDVSNIASKWERMLREECMNNPK